MSLLSYTRKNKGHHDVFIERPSHVTYHAYLVNARVFSGAEKQRRHQCNALRSVPSQYNSNHSSVRDNCI